MDPYLEVSRPRPGEGELFEYLRQFERQDAQLFAVAHLPAGAMHPDGSQAAGDELLPMFLVRAIVGVDPNGIVLFQPGNNVPVIQDAWQSYEFRDVRLNDDIVAHEPQRLCDQGTK